jgi:hypothetical protein
LPALLVQLAPQVGQPLLALSEKLLDLHELSLHVREVAPDAPLRPLQARETALL